jgi:hypothetical protein
MLRLTIVTVLPTSISARLAFIKLQWVQYRSCTLLPNGTMQRNGCQQAIKHLLGAARKRRGPSPEVDHCRHTLLQMREASKCRKALFSNPGAAAAGRPQSGTKNGTTSNAVVHQLLFLPLSAPSLYLLELPFP